MSEQIKIVSGKVHVVRSISFPDMAIVYSPENICLLRYPKHLKKDLFNNDGKVVKVNYMEDNVSGFGIIISLGII